MMIEFCAAISEQLVVDVRVILCPTKAQVGVNVTLDPFEEPIPGLLGVVTL